MNEADKVIKLKNTLPMGNTVILKNVDQARTLASGVIIPGQHEGDQFLLGEVVWVGPGVEYCRVGHHVKYKGPRATPITIEEEQFYMGKEDLIIEMITDYFKDGGSLAALIAYEQAKRIAGQYYAQHKDLAPDIANKLSEFIITKE